MPADAAIWRSNPQLAGWTTADHLLALLIEVVDAAGWRTVTPHLKKNAKPQPIRIQRPGGGHDRPRRSATSEDMKRLFGAVAVYRPKEVTSGD